MKVTVKRHVVIIAAAVKLMVEFCFIFNFYASANYNVVAGGIMFLECSCVHLSIRGLRAQISLERMEILTSGKRHYQL